MIWQRHTALCGAALMTAVKPSSAPPALERAAQTVSVCLTNQTPLGEQWEWQKNEKEG